MPGKVDACTDTIMRVCIKMQICEMGVNNKHYRCFFLIKELGWKKRARISFWWMMNSWLFIFARESDLRRVFGKKSIMKNWNLAMKVIFALVRIGEILFWKKLFFVSILKREEHFKFGQNCCNGNNVGFVQTQIK